MHFDNTHLRARSRPRHDIARGFTLIEMLVVMTLIALLLTLAVPRYFSVLDNGRLNVQRQNVATIRDAIDKFFGDQGKYPDSLDELVVKRYLRQVPLDPLTEAPNWVLIAPQDQSLGAVFDVQPASSVPAAATATAATATAATRNATMITPESAAATATETASAAVPPTEGQ
jgi:general secretion pathway protein G